MTIHSSGGAAAVGPGGQPRPERLTVARRGGAGASCVRRPPDLGKDVPIEGSRGRIAVSKTYSAATPGAATPVAAKHDLAATAEERRAMGRQARVLAPRADLG